MMKVSASDVGLSVIMVASGKMTVICERNIRVKYVAAFMEVARCVLMERKDIRVYVQRGFIASLKGDVLTVHPTVKSA